MKDTLKALAFWAALTALVLWQCSPSTKGKRRDAETSEVFRMLEANHIFIDIDCGTSGPITLIADKGFGADTEFGREGLKAVWLGCARKRGSFDQIDVYSRKDGARIATFTYPDELVDLDPQRLHH